MLLVEENQGVKNTDIKSALFNMPKPSLPRWMGGWIGGAENGPLVFRNLISWPYKLYAASRSNVSSNFRSKILIVRPITRRKTAESSCLKRARRGAY